MNISTQNNIAKLKALLSAEPAIAFAVLIGSQAAGNATEHSDWDIAIKWQQNQADYLDHLSSIETLRQKIATALNATADAIDLIDIDSARLAMCALICDEGLVLTEPYALTWLHFLQRTWRELEDYYWDELYVA